MADLLFEPRAWETTTGTGTGMLALAGAAVNETSFRTLSASGYVDNSKQLIYLIRHFTQNEWELGSGHQASGYLNRDHVYRSSNSNALVNFSIGTKDIMVIGWPGFGALHEVGVDTTLGFEHDVVRVSAAVTRTITLPDAKDFVGKKYTIIRGSTGSVVISASGSDVVYDPTSSGWGSSYTIEKQNGSVTVVSNGWTGWEIISTPGLTFNILSPFITADVSVTAATTLTSAAFGKMHDISGTTADYTVTLPAVTGNTGKIIGLRVSNIGAANRLYTIDGNSTETIDGMSSLDMWAMETLILLCTGTRWTIIGGRSRPMNCIMRRTTSQSIAYNTWTQIQTVSVVEDNTSGLAVPMCDTTNGRVRARRAGRYQANGFASITGVLAGREFNGGVSKNNAAPGDDPNAFTTVSVPASTVAQASGTAGFTCVAGDWIAAVCFHDDSGGSRNTRAVGTVYPTLSVTEIPPW